MLRERLAGPSLSVNFAFVYSFRMLSASPSRIKAMDAACAGFDRPSLLRQLGLPIWSPFVGDIPDLKSVSVQGARAVRVNKINAPFIDRGSAFECCSGAKLRRCGPTVVAIPCYETTLSHGASVCLHCEELWANVQADGWFTVDASMKNVLAEYSAGETIVLRNWSCMKLVADQYSDMIQLTKDVLKGGAAELEASWPGKSFEDLVHDLLLSPDVLFEGSDSSKRKYLRSVGEQGMIAQYLEQILPLYLKVRALTPAKELQESMKTLFDNVKLIANSATYRLQAEMPEDRIFCGAIMEADVMLAAFTFAAAPFDSLVKRLQAKEVKDTSEWKLDWGQRITMFKAWAELVPAVEQPAARKLPKLPVTSSSFKSTSSTARGFYAVVEGFTTGVLESLQEALKATDGYSGAKWKRFRTKAEAEAYMAEQRTAAKKEGPKRKGQRNAGQSSASKAAVQRKLFSGKHAERYFAVYSGNSRGVYNSMLEVSRAINEGDGEYAQFDTEDEAWACIEEAGAQEAERQVEEQPDKFVVWAGTKVGIMSRVECTAATAKLAGARMLGPLSAAEVSTKWKEVTASAVVLTRVNEASSTKGSLNSKTASSSSGPEVHAREQHASSSAEASGSIVTPSEEELSAAFDADNKTVYACIDPSGKQVIALSAAEASRGLQDPQMRVLSSGQSVVENFVLAETWLKKMSRPVAHVKQLSMSERLAKARVQLSQHAGSAVKPGVAVSTSAAPTGTNPISMSVAGKTGRRLLGRSGLRFSREAAQIARVFIDDPDPIVRDPSGQLFDYELAPLPPPASQLFLGSSSKFTLKEYAQMAGAKSGEYS